MYQDFEKYSWSLKLSKFVVNRERALIFKVIQLSKKSEIEPEFAETYAAMYPAFTSKTKQSVGKYLLDQQCVDEIFFQIYHV